MPKDDRQSNPCYVWDVVCNIVKDQHGTHGTVPTVDSVHNALRSFCKSYVFQLEKSESGFDHYQGRITLIKKDRGTIATAIAAKIGEHVRFTMIPTVSENRAKECFYQLKEQTKVAGPWKDTDFVMPQKKTRQMEEFEDYEKYPWQQKVIELSQQWDKRTIHVVVDAVGNNGKTDLVEWLVQNGKGTLVPPMRAMEDIMAMVMCKPPARCYLIDMPRAMRKEKLYDFYSGIESLKNGYMYDKRYQFKDRWIDRPQIIIFSNMMPDFSMLSQDRWKVWQIIQKELTVYKSMKVSPQDGVQTQVSGGQEEDMVEEAQDVQPPQDHLRQEGETSNDESLRVQEQGDQPSEG